LFPFQDGPWSRVAESLCCGLLGTCGARVVLPDVEGEAVPGPMFKSLRVPASVTSTVGVHLTRGVFASGSLEGVTVNAVAALQAVRVRGGLVVGEFFRLLCAAWAAGRLGDGVVDALVHSLRKWVSRCYHGVCPGTKAWNRVAAVAGSGDSAPGDLGALNSEALGWHLLRQAILLTKPEGGMGMSDKHLAAALVGLSHDLGALADTMFTNLVTATGASLDQLMEGVVGRGGDGAPVAVLKHLLKSSQEGVAVLDEALSKQGTIGDLVFRKSHVTWSQLFRLYVKCTDPGTRLRDGLTQERVKRRRGRGRSRTGSKKRSF